MANDVTIAAFLRDRLGLAAPPKSLDALQGLAESGDQFHFCAQIAEAKKLLEAWLPLYVLPVARDTSLTGIHLRPSDVASGRLAFVNAEEDHTLIEVAGSVEALVYGTLADAEGYVNETGKTPNWVARKIERANQVFGPNFYALGRHGKFTSVQAARATIDVFGGSPAVLHEIAIFTEDQHERLAAFERGIQAEPGCFLMYSGAARALVELGERERAAGHVAKSLACYFHTAYTTDFDDYLELGRALASEFPTYFDEDARIRLDEDDPKNWARRASDLFKAGQLERSEKLLNDMCYRLENYEIALRPLRQHYEKLGWQWALALCDLRG